jgi:hypothetical protein
MIPGDLVSFGVSYGYESPGEMFPVEEPSFLSTISRDISVSPQNSGAVTQVNLPSIFTRKLERFAFFFPAQLILYQILCRVGTPSHLL